MASTNTFVNSAANTLGGNAAPLGDSYYGLTSTASQYPNGPGGTPLTLGAVTFFTAECPDVLNIGTADQILAVHTLVGGGRVVQSLGVSANEVSWSGKFFDTNVAVRVAQLRLYLTSGNEILLTWGTERYYTKVKTFTPKYRAGYAEYDIVCVITKDANGAFTISAPLSIDQQVQSLQIQANTANSAILAPIAPVDLSSSAAALPTISPAAISAANQASMYQNSLSALNAAINIAGPIAQNITRTGPGIISAALTASQQVGSFVNTIGQSSPAFANANLLLSSILGISANVTRGQSPATTVVQGMNLFRVSAQQYGNVTQGFNLGAANKLPSPFVSAITPTNLLLPPFGS